MGCFPLLDGGGRRLDEGLKRKYGAGKEARTPDLNLGKVALYQLSYSRGAQGAFNRGAIVGPQRSESRTGAQNDT
jgi:hypothetical protein